VVIDPLRPDAVDVHARAVPLSCRVEVRSLDDAVQVAGDGSHAAEAAIPVMAPEQLIPALGHIVIVIVVVDAL
jgi:hypothetical protein